jgi:DNA helicase-2/ATP-dependent DNA helicase PcrA
VRPERVLGLTFTRKAAAELAGRVRARLAGLRRAGFEWPAGDATDDDEELLTGEPVISTYHAYAGRLLGDHALREGLEPTLRLITPAVCWQLASGVVAGYDGPTDALEWTPATVTAAVLALAGEMSEHLRSTADVTALTGKLADDLAAVPGRVTKAVRDVLATQRTREQLLPLVSAYTAAKAAREVVD